MSFTEHEERGCQTILVRTWCESPGRLEYDKGPGWDHVPDLGLSGGAGDENRTRALSLGSTDSFLPVCDLTCANVLSTVLDEGR
jgi:hypothetical protein